MCTRSVSRICHSVTAIASTEHVYKNIYKYIIIIYLFFIIIIVVGA